jgi:hypothetical protein
VRTARRLGNAVLLSHDGYSHTSPLDPSTCVQRATSAYLVRLATSPRGTVCTSDRQPFDPEFGEPLPWAVAPDGPLVVTARGTPVTTHRIHTISREVLGFVGEEPHGTWLARSDFVLEHLPTLGVPLHAVDALERGEYYALTFTCRLAATLELDPADLFSESDVRAEPAPAVHALTSLLAAHPAGIADVELCETLGIYLATLRGLRGLARRRLRPAGLTILVTRGGTHRLVGSRKPRDTALPKCLASPARSRGMPPPLLYDIVTAQGNRGWSD